MHRRGRGSPADECARPAHHGGTLHRRDSPQNGAVVRGRGANRCRLERRPTQIEESLARYGRHIGTAFQLVDDALDYQADETSLGKHLGDDLAEGKPTLPVIYAMQHGNDDQRTMIRHAIEHGGLGQLAEITRAVASLGGLRTLRASLNARLIRRLLRWHPFPKPLSKKV